MGCSKLILVIALCCVGSFLAADDQVRVQEQKIINELLKRNVDGTGYNPDIRPTNSSDPKSPVTVEINMYIRHVHYLDESTGTWKIQATFRQQWTDHRLAHKQENSALSYLTLPHARVIWTPDTFFSNELEAKEHNLWRPNQLLRIFPDGKVLFSSRITLSLSSPSLTTFTNTLTKFANFRLASYGYTTDDILYVWKPTDAIQVTPELALKNFEFNKFITEDCTSRTITGLYSCLKASFEFKKVAGICNA